MNQASPSLLIEAISKNDPAQLHKLAGVGKKTSENVVQYLHTKLDTIGIDVTTERTADLSAAKTDAIDALVSLGYDLATARSVVGEFPEDLSVNELVTKALKEVS